MTIEMNVFGREFCESKAFGVYIFQNGDEGKDNVSGFVLFEGVVVK